ncbi:MAG: dihydropteroate synthase [Acidimicrobiia bacterium]
MSTNRDNIPNSWSDVLKDNPFLIFGILNVTPDSFSDGGKFENENDINNQITTLKNDGANVIDIGAESTRLGSEEVVSSQEILRLEETFSIVKNLSNDQTLFSIDTRHAQTAQEAMANRFQVINDVSACRFDEKMREVMASTGSLVVLMHSRSTPKDMTNFANYKNVLDEVCSELEQQINYVTDAGVDVGKIMVDPGIGFAKSPKDGIKLIENIDKFKSRLGLPVLVGVSRKTIISYMISGDPKSVPFEERDELTGDMSRILREAGVDAVRVHNVAQTIKSL